VRRKATAMTLVIAIAAAAAYAQGGLAFSVRPGLLINAAHVGYKADNFFIGGGLEFATASWSDNYKTTHYDTMETYDTTYTDEYGSNVSASVFLPQVAAKYYFGGDALEANGNGGGFARPFVGLCAFYSLASASVSTTDNDSIYKDTTTSRMVQDVLGGNFGGTVSFGGEYYISRSLSLSAEFGARFLWGGVDQKYRDEYYYGYGDVTMMSKLGLGLTYTTLGLNFYF